jgi:hypothetical protein
VATEKTLVDEWWQLKNWFVTRTEMNGESQLTLLCVFELILLACMLFKRYKDNSNGA